MRHEEKNYGTTTYSERNLEKTTHLKELDSICANSEAAETQAQKNSKQTSQPNVGANYRGHITELMDHQRYIDHKIEHNHTHTQECCFDACASIYSFIIANTFAFELALSRSLSFSTSLCLPLPLIVPLTSSRSLSCD